MGSLLSLLLDQKGQYFHLEPSMVTLNLIPTLRGEWVQGHPGLYSEVQSTRATQWDPSQQLNNKEEEAMVGDNWSWGFDAQKFWGSKVKGGFFQYPVSRHCRVTPDIKMTLDMHPPPQIQSSVFKGQRSGQYERNMRSIFKWIWIKCGTFFPNTGLHRPNPLELGQNRE